MLNAFGEWVLGIADNPKRALVLSLALNAALALVLVGGQFVHLTVDDGKWSIRPASRDLRAQVAGLLSQPERRGEVRSLLEEKGFFEISDDNRVVLTVSERKSIAAGRAAVCEREDDLSHKWLLVWNPDGLSGFDVQVSERVACTSADKQLVELSREDWEKLGVEGRRRTEAVVRVYLHKPPERVGAGPATVVTQDAPPTRM